MRRRILVVLAVLDIARGVLAQAVSLAWDPSPDASVVGYNIYYGSASGVYTKGVSVGSVTNTSISNLVAGVTYYFVATAYDGTGLESEPSNEVAYSPPVSGTNQPPRISAITDQSTLQDTPTAAIAFTLSEPGKDPSNLIVSGVSSNQFLTPDPTLLFGGAGSNRTVTLTPASGQSGDAIITIRVSDGVTNSSASFRLSVFSSLVKGPQLTLQTKGKGKITSGFKIGSLIPGKNYSVTAVPDGGQVFAGWRGGITSSVPQLSFVLTSNLVLEADFVPSPFIATAGTYNGLFYESDQVRQSSAGAFAVSVTTKGTYSGRLRIGANRYPFTGRLDLQNHGANTIPRRTASNLQLAFSVGSGAQADQLSGQLTDGTWISTLSGDRALFNARTNPVPWVGSYTLVIPGQDNDPALPFGHGFATMRVQASGVAKVAGTLAEGTKFTGSAPVSKLGSWPLYVSLYAGNGSVLSWLIFTNRAQSDVGGLLSWIKPANMLARYYPGGFAEEYAAAGSRYVMPPVSGTILSLTNTTLTFSGGNLASDFTNSLALNPGSHVTNLSSNRLALNFSLSTGLFTGSATDPSSGKALSFKGVVLQKQNAGFGFLLGTNLSSRVVLGQ